MSIKSFSAKLFAKYIAGKTQKWSANPVATQDAVFQYLIKKAKRQNLEKTIILKI